MMATCKRSSSGPGRSHNVKRGKFDPVFVKERVKESTQLKRSLISALGEFRNCVEAVMQSSLSNEILLECSPDVIEICFAAYYGLEGVELLRLANNMVPASFMNLKNAYVADIMNMGVQDEKKVNAAQVKNLLTVTSKCNNFFGRSCDHSYKTELRKLSLESKRSFMYFIAPPVQKCINSLCKKYHQHGSLYIQNREVNVVVHSLQGPMPATKVSLRCNQCSTIYNYSMFGCTQSVGMRYYPQPQPLIEVCNTVYCTRELYAYIQSLR